LKLKEAVLRTTVSLQEIQPESDNEQFRGHIDEVLAILSGDYHTIQCRSHGYGQYCHAMATMAMGVALLGALWPLMHLAITPFVEDIILAVSVILTEINNRLISTCIPTINKKLSYR